MTPFRILFVLFTVLIHLHISISAPKLYCINQCGPGLPPCPANKRCVYNDCSYLCMKQTEQDPRCPSSESFGFCTDLCSHIKNSGCEKGFLCCFNGCGNYCYNPESKTIKT